MTIRNLLSPAIPPLHPSDTVEHALGLLLEHSAGHLPVVDEESQLVGIISEDQLLEAFAPEAEIRTFLGPRPVSTRPDDHVFDATKLMVQHELSTLPVAEADGTYVGLARRYDIFEQFARMLSTQEPGAILALEIDSRDYSMAQLVHIIEQTDAKVRSVSSEPPETAYGPTRVTVKLNTTDATRVRHMIEHHGYDIVASFGEDDDNMLERVQAFMRYLEV